MGQNSSTEVEYSVALHTVNRVSILSTPSALQIHQEWFLSTAGLAIHPKSES